MVVAGTVQPRMQMPLCPQMVHLAARRSPTTLIDGGNKVYHYFIPWITITSELESFSLNKASKFHMTFIYPREQYTSYLYFIVLTPFLVTLWHCYHFVISVM